LATRTDISAYEKIGFPDSYRKDREGYIFDDILAKIPIMHQKNKQILDIGPGCAELPRLLAEFCQAQGNQLFFIDAPEMLELLPQTDFIKHIPGKFPSETSNFIETYSGKIDVIICYSVFHYIYVEGNIYKFLDDALSLLADGGAMLLGDIPNISKRKRFFSSNNGRDFHQKFMNTTDAPRVQFNCLEPEGIDDGVISGIVQRYRCAGFDVYILPQPVCLPMANRREDLLFIRP
jgi:2-polyprenyl-3-methyl-5-hydroxy-6-metoxy-1,4-benzoquinol methylase